MTDDDITTFKHGIDALSIVTVLGTLMSFLPAIAALFTIIWTLIRIWETDTIRSLTSRTKDAEQIVAATPVDDRSSE